MTEPPVPYQLLGELNAMIDKLATDPPSSILEIGVWAGGTLAALVGHRPHTDARVSGYRTIVADPPWEYPEGFPQGTSHGLRRMNRDLPYSGMALDEIAGLQVASVADDDAWLYLWTTNKYLPHAFPIIQAWGFEYRQTITWRKTGDPSPFVRSVAPQHSEYLLVARRGSPDREGAFPSTVIDATATDHSRKPELFLDLVEQVSPGPYLEMFARRQRLGWDTWGSEALEHVDLTAAGTAAANG